MKTESIYIVTFSDAISQGIKFEPYPLRVRAFDLEEAQEKAIELAESAEIIHGSIKSITRSVSQY